MTVIKNHRLLLLLLLISFVLHSGLALIPPLNGDEATFWEWSRHLALGYYAHPPMTSWLVAISTRLFGISAYSVRLASIILHLGSVFFVYLLTLEITNNRSPAFNAAVIYSLMPLSTLLGTAMTTDSALIFCFIASVYLVRKAIIDQKRIYWYIAAIACGAMLLSKFMAVLFFPGLVLFVLLTKKYRYLIARKEPYLALLISLIIFSPFLYWNMTNNWLTFQFNFFMRHKDHGGKAINPLLYIAGQMLAASPIFFIGLLCALVSFSIFFIKKQGDEENRVHDSILMLCYFTFFPLLFFLLISFRTEVGAHWAGIVFPTASVLLAIWMFSDPSVAIFHSLRKKRLFQSGSALSILMSLAICTLVVFPKIVPDKMIYTPAVYLEAPIMSHYFGWKEVGKRIDEIRQKWESKPEGFFFTSKDYSLAAMLGFYTPSHPQFYLMNVTEKVVHGKSFLIWEKGKKKLGANTIYISDTPDSFRSSIPPFFKDYQHLQPLVIRDKQGRILRVFYFTVGIHYLGGEPNNLSLW